MKRPLTMDLNQSIEFPPSSPQIHNLMPITSSILPFNQPSNEDREEVKQSHLVVQNRDLKFFWYQQMMDIQSISVFKNQHQLPLARIKRVMKSVKDVKMISADTPVIFSKACELFILELTFRAWQQTEDGNRRTLQGCDFARAIRQAKALRFLIDSIPLIDDHKDDDGKFVEEKEHDAVNQLQCPMLDMNAVSRLQCPMLDMNAELGMRSPEAQQIKPPTSSHELIKLMMPAD